VTAAYITGGISVQGVVTSTGTGLLDLRNAAGDNALLGYTTFGSFAENVLPGTYDIYYRNNAAGPGLPVNQSAKLRSGVVVPAAGAGFDVEIPATAVSGTFTVNGTAPSFGANNLHLRNANGDDAVLGTVAMSGTYATVVVPGTYDLYYSNASALTGVPVNQSAKLQSGIVVGSSPVTLNIDVPATTISGTFTINGSSVPPANPGVLLLQNTTDLSAFVLASSVGTYSTRAIPGTYDLYYRVYSAETGVFLYQPTKLQSGIVVGASALTLNVDVPTATVSGTVTVNGAQVPAAGGNGRLTLRNATATRPFATTAAGTYSAPVVPGTYDLYYTAVTVGTGVPSNTSVKLRSGVVIGSSAQTLNIDIPATAVTGTIKVNGAQVDQAMGTGDLRLRNAAGDDALLGSTGIVGAYSQLVVAGTYDLYYAMVAGGTGVPANKSATLRSGVVVGSTPLALDIDVSAPMVSGTLGQNGVQYVTSTGAYAYLILQNAGGDKATIGGTFSGTYSCRVIPGTYTLTYAMIMRSPGIPANTLGALGCYTVP
jgi:hypothetical protein